MVAISSLPDFLNKFSCVSGKIMCYPLTFFNAQLSQLGYTIWVYLTDDCCTM